MSVIKILLTIFNLFFFKSIVAIYKLKKQINTNNHAIVLIDNNDEVNFYSFAHLKEYFDFYALDSIKVFTNSKFIIDNFKEILPNATFIKSVTFINNKQKDFFIKSNRLGCSNILVPALNEPADKNLNRLINVHGLTIEDLVCFVEYRLFEYKKINISDEIRSKFRNFV